MAIKENDVISIAKSGTTKKRTTTKKKGVKKATTKKNTVKKPVDKVVEKPAEVVVEKELTPKEVRDLKANEMVDNLLSDVDLTATKPKLENDAPELEVEAPVVELKGVEWLEEQVKLLTEQNEVLVQENAQLKSGGFEGNDEVKDAVLRLFDELQSNHLKMGTNPKTGMGNFTIHCPGFLNRMVKNFFPFLEEYKKF